VYVVWGRWLDSTIAEQNTMTGQCEYGNETSGLNKIWIFGRVRKIAKSAY